MYTPQHLNHLRGMVANAEQAAREAEQDLAGWRSLLAHAEANAPQLPPPVNCWCGLPGTPGVMHRAEGPCYQVPDSGIHAGRNPYGTPEPAPFDQQPGLTPGQEQAHTAFLEFHGDLCKNDGGPRKADVCVVPLNADGIHEGRHDDGNGHTWANTTNLQPPVGA